LSNVTLDNLAANIDQETVSPEECQEVIRALARTHGLSEPQSFAAVSLLMLKGACNQSAPSTMCVDIKDGDHLVQVSKHDLQYAYQLVCKNNHIRRLAEALNLEIGKFAEKFGLNGDLAITLNNMLMEKGFPPLTAKERAWASSFNQKLTCLSEIVGMRVPTLLAEDFNRRFPPRKPKAKQDKAGKGPPRPRQDGGQRTSRRPDPGTPPPERRSEPGTGRRPSPPPRRRD
jgi:hypothetical protein